MSDKLFPYYERELLFIRQAAQEFAVRYPAAAGRLLLEPNRSIDPHVERMIESFALLAGRIHHKLDDEFPELTDALLNVLYPHYLAPIPSMAIVQFDLAAARAKLPRGFLIDRNSHLHTPPIQDVPCRFRTAYPVTLWPVALTAAELLPPPFPVGLRPPPRTKSAIILRLEAQAGMKFADLALEKLRFFLSGENHVVANLYEMLFNNVVQVLFRAPEGASPPEPFALPPRECLFQVGLEREDAILPFPKRSFSGYRLLTEFFAFPSKFLFLDLGGFGRVCRGGYQRQLEIILFLDRHVENLEQAVDPDTFRLGCTPMVNLFERLTEPIRLTQEQFEYRVIPDVARPKGLEVYSVEGVRGVDPVSNRTVDYMPFYSVRHGHSGEGEPRFWYATRRPSGQQGDRGTEVYLNLVDLEFTPRLPAESTLVVRTTCTNRDLPAQLQQFGDQLKLVLEGAAPLAGIRCLRAPTRPLRPPMGRGAYWRLISHLSLNHLSLCDPDEGRDALQELLRLYDFSDPELGKQRAAVTRNLIEGIAAVSSRRVVARVGGRGEGALCRGVEITIEFDEQKYVGTGIFLFASVLERFLALYASINSFSQLVAKTRQGEGYFKRWPPRPGEPNLL